MIGRAIIYLLPFYLIFFELILRISLNTDTANFIAPTLASVGIGLVVPLTIHKNNPNTLPLSEEIVLQLEEKKITYMTIREKRFIELTWLVMFILIASWTYTVYLSCQSQIILWLHFPIQKSLIFGFFNYFVGIIFSEIKEVI